MWFKTRKTQAFERLSEAAKIWAQGVTKKTLKNDLMECVYSNQPERILYLLEAFRCIRASSTTGRAIRYAAARWAIQAEAPEALSAILSKNSFDLSNSEDGDDAAAHRLFCLAGRASLPLWTALNHINETSEYGKLKECTITVIASRPETSFDIIAHYLNMCGESFRSSLDLNGLLVRAAAAGEAKYVQLFLKNGAHPMYDDGLALVRAAEGNQKETMEVLLPLIPRDQHELILASLTLRRSASPLVDELKKTIGPVKTPEPPPAAPDGSFALIGGHTLAETQTLPTGTTLTTLFNFEMRRETVIIDKNQPGTPPVVTARDFDEIGARDALEARWQKLIDMHGSAEHPFRIHKPKPPTLAQKGEV